jgi:hypothetical protein
MITQSDPKKQIQANVNRFEKKLASPSSQAKKPRQSKKGRVMYGS